MARFVYELSSSDSEEEENARSRTKPRGVIQYTGDSDSSDAESEDIFSDDSEELEYPVSKAAGSKAPTNLSLYLAADQWELLDDKARKQAWAASKWNELDTQSPKREVPPWKQKQELDRKKKRDNEILEITNALQELEIKRKEEEAAIHAAFDSRNTELWQSIEQAIKAQEAEAAALAAARAKQEEAERQARQAREDALKKQQQEKEERAAKERKAQEDALAQQREKEVLAKAEEERMRAELEKESKQAGSGSAEWQKWYALMGDIKTRVLPVVSRNDAWRKSCREAKRVITPKVGQLTNSQAHINTIAQAISTALQQLQGVSPEAYTWGLNHLSKALIKQAETEVTARLEGAFPLARLTLILTTLGGHTQLADVLMARLVKKCFWIAGYYPPRRLVEQNTADGLDADSKHKKLLGHSLKAQENLMGYAQRMSGTMSLYAAIVSLSTSYAIQTNVEVAPQFRPAALWSVLVALFSPPLSPLEPAPRLIESIMYVAGKMLMQTFGRQWTKLWKVLQQNGLIQGQAEFTKKDVPWVKASIAKLQLLLEDWQTKGISTVPGSEVEP